jgi:hypothetical protein
LTPYEKILQLKTICRRKKRKHQKDWGIASFFLFSTIKEYGMAESPA